MELAPCCTVHLGVAWRNALGLTPPLTESGSSKETRWWHGQHHAQAPVTWCFTTWGVFHSHGGIPRFSSIDGWSTMNQPFWNIPYSQFSWSIRENPNKKWMIVHKTNHPALGVARFSESSSSRMMTKWWKGRALTKVVRKLSARRRSLNGYLNILVGGLEHFLSHILGISSSQLTFHIFQRGEPTTNQYRSGDIPLSGLVTEGFPCY